MHARTWLGAAALVVGAASAGAEPKPKPVDVKASRDQMIVLQDARGGTYVVWRDDSVHVFYSPNNGPLHEQSQGGGGYRDGDAWLVRVYAPRSRQHYAEIMRSATGEYTRSCGPDESVGMSEVTGDKRKQILAKSQFLSTSIVYVPFTFARDEVAVYYYVDQISAAYGGGGYRLFVGKKGAMKPMTLTDVSIDSRGAVLSTKQGDLSVTRERDNTSVTKAAWIQHDKRVELLTLDTVDNATIIYRDLGIYGALGTICDDS
jgi:hypothetical protein